MVRPKLPSWPPRPARPPARPAAQNSDAWLGCGLVAAVLLGIGAISKCSGTPAPDNAAANFIDGSVSNGIAAQTPTPVEPLNAAAVTRGTAHLRLAITAEGFPGAMIYSQNCYDSLAHRFAWAKLDTCGAFDMLAVRSIADADTANLTTETGYFQSEAAAGRYLAAATAAGEPATAADSRLSQLQGRIARAATAGRRAAPTPTPMPTREANNAALEQDNAIPPGDSSLDDEAVDE